jgi:hypothetical protein
VVALLGANPPAYAETYGKAGDWIVDGDGAGSCLLTRTIGEARFAFATVWDDKTKTAYWALMFNVPEFSSMALERAYSADLVIQGTAWTEATDANVEDASGYPFLFVRIFDMGFEQAFRRGSELTVLTKIGQYRIPLDHSAEGQDIFIACMTDPTNGATIKGKSP